MALLPTFIVHPALWIISYVNLNMGLEIPQLGLEAESIGHYLINDVSQLNLE